MIVSNHTLNSSVCSGKRSVPSLVPYGAPAENRYLVFSGLTAGALLSSVGIVGRPARGNAVVRPRLMRRSSAGLFSTERRYTRSGAGGFSLLIQHSESLEELRYIR